MTKNERLLKEIKDQCIVDECWIWKGGIKNGRSPYVTVDGKPISTRRYVAELAGISLGKKLASTTCCDSRCVCPEHIKPMSQSELQARKSKLTNHQSSIQRLIKLRKTKRATLDIEKARHIRSLQGVKTNKQLAKEFGVGETQIGRVMMHKVWRELENPFHQLVVAANSTWRREA